jgi:hypothetical protein
VYVTATCAACAAGSSANVDNVASNPMHVLFFVRRIFEIRFIMI